MHLVQKSEDMSLVVMTEGRPNVVFVFADQWRAQAVGYADNDQVQTPNLDRLAAEGIRYKFAYANAPVCAVARCSIITGRYAPEAILNAADLVTEMRPIKHYADAGVPARNGIEE